MPYATTDNVESLFPGREITVSSPMVTTTDVSDWIAEAESELNRELAAAAFTVPVTDGDVTPFLRYLVVSKVAARVEIAFRSEGDYATQIDPERYAAVFDRFILQIRDEPSRIGALIKQPLTGAEQGVFRSHITDNSAGKSIANGDFKPRFTMDTEF